MQTAVTNPQLLAETIGAAIKTAAAVSAAGIRDLAEIQPLVDFVKVAEEREDALAIYRKAKDAHRRFATRHSADDPAHDDYQRELNTAHGALVATEQILAAKLADLRQARGL